MIICGVIISPVGCEFQNWLLPCSWYHLITPTSNQLPKTGPWFSFSIAVTMGIVTHHLLFLLFALFLSRTALFTQMLNSSLPCTLTWWNLSTSLRSPNTTPPIQSSVVNLSQALICHWNHYNSLHTGIAPLALPKWPPFWSFQRKIIPRSWFTALQGPLHLQHKIRTSWSCGLHPSLHFISHYL